MSFVEKTLLLILIFNAKISFKLTLQIFLGSVHIRFDVIGISLFRQHVKIRTYSITSCDF